MATYAMPGFAYTTSSEADAVKVELTDEAMSQAVGAGNVDATMADYTVGSSTAQAVIANRSVLSCDYSLSVTDVNGVVTEVLVSGNIAPDTALVVSGTPSNPSAFLIQAKITNSGVPGLLSLDSSWAL
jgi:hypothetical protein